MDWRWKNFSSEELKCKHCGEEKIIPEFMDRLQALRKDYGKPMKISSGYRCPIHNRNVSKTGDDGPHTTGRAVDILCHGKEAYDLLHLALLHGFTGIGINQKGLKASRFIHIDDIPDRTIRPTVFSY